MKELVIDRAKWHRGKGPNESCLLRNGDGKMCCLGFYMAAVGTRPAELRGTPYPSRIKPLPEEARWLFHKATMQMPSGSTDDGSTDDTWQTFLATTNDHQGIPDERREREIRDAFATQGIAVSFVGWREGSPTSSAAEGEKP